MTKKVDKQQVKELTFTLAFSYATETWRHMSMCFSWLTTVFLRLNSARYHCLPDVSINRACKNDAINPNKKRKPLQHLKGVKSVRYM